MLRQKGVAIQKVFSSGQKSRILTFSFFLSFIAARTRGKEEQDMGWVAGAPEPPSLECELAAGMIIAGQCSASTGRRLACL